MFTDFFENKSPDEIKKEIKQIKKNDPNPLRWKELTVAYVTNNLEIDIENLEVIQENGEYLVVYKSDHTKFDLIENYINECQADNSFYEKASQYLQTMKSYATDLKIASLEERLNSGVPTQNEKETKIKQRISNLVFKIVIVIIVVMCLYVCARLFASTFKSG